MGRRLMRGRPGLFMMDSDPAMRGLYSVLTGGRWRRDDEGHPDIPDSGEDEDDDDDDDEDEDDDEEKPTSKKSSGKGKSSKKSDDDEDDDEDATVPAWKYEKLERRMRATD